MKRLFAVAIKHQRFSSTYSNYLHTTFRNFLESLPLQTQEKINARLLSSQEHPGRSPLEVDPIESPPESPIESSRDLRWIQDKTSIINIVEALGLAKLSPYKITHFVSKAVVHAPHPVQEEIFLSVITSFYASRRWLFVITLAQKAFEYGISSFDICKCLFIALSRSNRSAEAITTYNQLTQYDFWVPDGEVMDYLVLSHLDQHNIPEANRLLQEKTRLELPTTPKSMDLLLRGMDQYGGHATLEDSILYGKSGESIALNKDVSVINRIMHSRVKRKQPIESLDVFYKFFHRDDDFPAFKLPPHAFGLDIPVGFLRPDDATFLNLARIAFQLNQPRLALDLLEYGNSHNVPFNPHYLSGLLRAVSTNYSFKQVEELINAVSSAENGEKFKYLFEGHEFELVGFPMTPQLVGQHIKFLLEDQGLRGLHEFLDCSPPTFKPTSEIVTIIGNYIANSHPRNTLSSQKFILGVKGKNEILAQDLEVFLKSKNDRTRMPSIARKKLWTPTEHMYQENTKPDLTGSLISITHEALHSRSVKHTSKIVQYALKEKMDSPEEMWKVLQELIIDVGILPTHQQISLIVKSALEGGNFELAREYMEKGIDAGAPRHNAYYGILLSGSYRYKNEKEATRVWEDLSKYNIHLDKLFHRVVALGIAKSGLYNRLLDYIEHHRLDKNDPNLVGFVFKAMIASGSLKDFRDAQRMVQNKLDEGFLPDRGFLTLINGETFKFRGAAMKHKTLAWLETLETAEGVLKRIKDLVYRSAIGFQNTEEFSESLQELQMKLKKAKYPPHMHYSE